MQLKLEMGAAGEEAAKKKVPIVQPLSVKKFEKFINSLPSNDIVKRKLLALSKRVPSVTLGYIVQNITHYISRAEFEIKQEELKIMQENKQYESENSEAEEGEINSIPMHDIGNTSNENEDQSR